MVRRVEGRSKTGKREGLMDMDNSVIIAGGGGRVEVEENIWRINGDRKTKKIKKK